MAARGTGSGHSAFAGQDLLDWLSPHPAIEASVYLRDGALVSYTRKHQNEPTQPRFFLARDAEIARAMVSTLARKLKTEEANEMQFTLPLHPLWVPAQALGDAKCRSWEAGMACELGPSPLSDYLAQVRAQQVAQFGRFSSIWPNEEGQPVEPQYCRQ